MPYSISLADEGKTAVKEWTRNASIRFELGHTLVDNLAIVQLES